MNDKFKNEASLASQSITQNRIDFLDFMRVFAFLSVLLGHKYYSHLAQISQNTNTHISFRYLAEGIMPLCFGGAAGVVVFFFVSGYIIMHVLQKEDAVEFLIKRVFRIYPLYIFAVLTEAYVGYMADGIELPSLSILVPRLLLLGDFFDTPYSLTGVEWTLRVEVMFYLFMAGLKLTGLIKRTEWLPLIFVICSILLYKVGPFPSFQGALTGYFSLYEPFLFIGTIIYLIEHKMANKKLCIASILFIFIGFLFLIIKIQPFYKDSNYAVFALLLFLSSWFFRAYLNGGPLIRFFSNMTYSIYLFHNWLWPYLGTIIIKTGITNKPPGILIFFALITFCYIAHRTVENYGIKLGHYVLKYRNRTSHSISKAI